MHTNNRDGTGRWLGAAAGTLGTTEALAKATSYALLLVFGLANLSLWRIKREQSHPPGIIRIPRWVPAMGFIASLAVVVIQLAIDLRP